jgi:hypothetical protein
LDSAEAASDRHSVLAVRVHIHEIFVLRQFGTISDKYLIKKRKKLQLTVNQSAMDTHDNVL